jgi:hypothetical protein
MWHIQTWEDIEERGVRERIDISSPTQFCYTHTHLSETERGPPLENISPKVIKGHIKSSAVKTKETKETEEAKQITFYDAYSFIVESFINETSTYLKALIR